MQVLHLVFRSTWRDEIQVFDNFGILDRTGYVSGVRPLEIYHCRR